MEKKWTLTGLTLLILAITLGAFGAHKLKEFLNEEQLVSFETGVRYQMYHAIAFLIVPFVLDKFKASGKAVFWLLIAGVILFSGSIYGLTVCNICGSESVKSIIGPLTPIGGVLMIAGWVVLFVKVLRSSNG